MITWEKIYKRCSNYYCEGYLYDPVVCFRSVSFCWGYRGHTLTHEIGAKSCKECQTSPSQLDAASDEDAEHTIGRATICRPTLDHNMVCVACAILKLRPFYTHEKGHKGVKRVKPAHLNSMPAPDEDAEHNNRRAVTRGAILDHSMVYVVAGKLLKLHPFYAHEMGVKRRKKCQTSPSQLDAGI